MYSLVWMLSRYRLYYAFTLIYPLFPCKRRPVITDKNPHVEGLQDTHKCIYLPSSMDKNQYLPSYLSQNVLFMELPSAPLFTPGIAPGLFFVTPKLAGCNIFVAHDPAIHKYWILRYRVTRHQSFSNKTGIKKLTF